MRFSVPEIKIRKSSQRVITMGIKMKNAVISLLAAFACALVVAGCASAPSGDQFKTVATPADGKAIIYVYRPNEYVAKAITLPVLLDGKKIAEIGNTGFFKVPVEPGEHRIVTETGSMIDDPITLNVNSGDIKFLRLNLRRNDPMGFSVSIYFTDMQRQLAEPELRSTSEEVKRYYGPKL
jgi:hypothetical protein